MCNLLHEFESAFLSVSAIKWIFFFFFLKKLTFASLGIFKCERKDR